MRMRSVILLYYVRGHILSIEKWKLEAGSLDDSGPRYILNLPERSSTLVLWHGIQDLEAGSWKLEWLRTYKLLNMLQKPRSAQDASVFTDAKAYQQSRNPRKIWRQFQNDEITKTHQSQESRKQSWSLSAARFQNKVGNTKTYKSSDRGRNRAINNSSS